MKHLLKKAINNPLVIAIIIISVLNLGYVLFTGWSSDDLIYQSDRATASLQHFSFLGYYLNTQIMVARFIGRIAPAMTCMILPYLLPQLIIYKIVLVLLTLTTLFLFYQFLKTLTHNNNFSLISILIVQLSFQFRLYHESLVSFYGVAQTMTCAILLCLTFLLKYQKNQKVKHLTVSLLSYTFLILSYEIGTLFIIPVTLFTFVSSSSLKDKLKIMSCFVLITATFLGFYVHNRLINQKNMNYSGAVISKSVPKFVGLYFNQTIAAFPLSYSLGRDGRLLKLNHVDLKFPYIAVAIVVSFIFLISLKALLARKDSPSRLDSKFYLFIFGCTLLLLPPLLTSMSIKYQADMSRVGFGFGYVFVFIQYFGAATLISLLLTYFSRQIRSSLAFILTLIFFLNFTNNLIVLRQAKTELYNHEIMLINFLTHPANTDFLKEKDYVLFMDQNDPTVAKTEFSVWLNAYPWKNQALIYHYSNKIVNVVDSKSLLEYYQRPEIKPVKLIIINSSNLRGQSYIQSGTIDRVVKQTDNQLLLTYHSSENISKTINLPL